MNLRDLCRTTGLTPIVTIVRARPVPEEEMRRLRIEAHAAAMRERYGATEEYERELWGPMAGGAK